MKVIIAGGRDTPHALYYVEAAVKRAGWHITEVVSGGARGIDQAGEVFAARNGIPVKRFPADWDKHGKAAGHIRNGEMAQYADALIAIWDFQSPGTKNMIDQAMKRGNMGVSIYPVQQ